MYAELTQASAGLHFQQGYSWPQNRQTVGGGVEQMGLAGAEVSLQVDRIAAGGFCDDNQMIPGEGKQSIRSAFEQRLQVFSLVPKRAVRESITGKHKVS